MSGTAVKHLAMTSSLDVYYINYIHGQSWTCKARIAAFEDLLGK
jgi:hypothetical protein